MSKIKEKLNDRQFPYISTVTYGIGYEAAAAIKLTSLIKADLFLDHSLEINSADAKPKHLSRQFGLHHQRTGLLQAISAWPSDLNVELHYLFNPSLLHLTQGRIVIFLLLKTRQKDELRAKEIIVKHYLSIKPLLSNFWKEAEFAPVIDPQEFDYLTEPFKPRHAMSIRHLVKNITLSEPIKQRSVGFSHLKESINELYSLTLQFPWRRTFDDWSILINTLMGQLDSLELIIRLKTATSIKRYIEQCENDLKICDEFLSSNKNLERTLERQASMVRETLLKYLMNLKENVFSISAFVLSSHPLDTSIGQLIGQSISASLAADYEKMCYEGGFQVKSAPAHKVRGYGYVVEKTPCPASEAACIFRLPSPPSVELFGVPIKHFRTSMASVRSSFSEDEYQQELFVNEHAGGRQTIRVPMDVRMQHMFVLGQTGTGKSTFLEHMILQDIEAGIGVGVIDPHGDMVDEILGKIPSERIDDVILINLLDYDRPIGLNVLQASSPCERDFIIDDLYLALDRIYDFRSTGGPMFEYYFRGMLKLLMGSGTNNDFHPTVLEFIRCFNEERFRDWLKSRFQDTTLVDFIQEIEDVSGEASLHNISPYITSKMNRFVHYDAMKRIIGQDRTAISFDEVMNQSKILLVKLGKGRFGSVTSAFIANYLVSCFKRTAMKRGDLPTDKRRDFALYVDECHNIPVENFTELLSEARKFRMALTLATQYTSQITGSGHQTSSLLSAVLGNVGTLITLRLGQKDAELLGKTFSPYFSSIDIAALPNWHGYAKVQASSHHGPAFSFKTIKNEANYRPDIAKLIIKKSRETYGIPWQEVDRQISERQRKWKNFK